MVHVRTLLGLQVLLLGAVTSCVTPKMIPGTHIPDVDKNRQIIKAVESYRQAMERKDLAKLMTMAHPQYYEHSGTPVGSDDYGYKGLLRVLRRRMPQLVAVRCNLKYVRIRWPSERQAELEVYISASFQLRTAEGERWYRMTDYNQMVLVRQNDRWLFLRGM